MNPVRNTPRIDRGDVWIASLWPSDNSDPGRAACDLQGTHPSVSVPDSLAGVPVRGGGATRFMRGRKEESAVIRHFRLEGFHGGFCPAVHLQRLQDIAHVVLHGLLRDAKFIGDFLVPEALCN